MNKFILFSLVGFSAVGLIGCIPDGPHKPLPTQGGAVQQASVGYDSIRPIFAAHCAACHPARSGPDWLDYSQAEAYAQNGKLLQRILIDRSMPPPGSPQAASITDSQRRTIGAWAKAGGPLNATSGGKAGAPQGGSVPEVPEADRVVQQCTQCHGTVTAGPGAQTKVPRLAGQNESYLVKEMKEFKWRQRLDPSQTMNDIAGDLSDADIVRVARYYSQAPGKALSSTSQQELKPDERALFEYGKLKAEVQCNSCHSNSQRDGRPLSDQFPVIVGQSKRYLMNQLIYFRANQRPGNLMLEMAKDLSNHDIEALATYFSSL